MRHLTQSKRFLAASAVSALVIACVFAIAADTQSQKQMDRQAAASLRLAPLVLGNSIPLTVQSPGIEWNGKTFHLLTLGSVLFDLDKADRLKADIQADVTTFDDVDYDIGCAVFDAEGKMLGVARAQCKVGREWLGRVQHSERTITLDFGVSLDYPNAKAFMISLSARKVLTPDKW